MVITLSYISHNQNLPEYKKESIYRKLTNKIFSHVELTATGYYPTEQVNTYTHTY